MLGFGRHPLVAVLDIRPNNQVGAIPGHPQLLAAPVDMVVSSVQLKGLPGVLGVDYGGNPEDSPVFHGVEKDVALAALGGNGAEV